MTHRYFFWFERIFDNWQNATAVDFAFATAWVLLAGFLIAKLTARPTA